MHAQKVPAQKVLNGHFVFAKSPTVLRLAFQLPVDPKLLNDAKHRHAPSDKASTLRLYEMLTNTLATGTESIKPPLTFVIRLQRNVLGLEYTVVNLQKDLMAEDVVARAEAQRWEIVWEDEMDYCDVKTGAMGRRQVGYVKLIVCDTETQIRYLHT